MYSEIGKKYKRRVLQKTNYKKRLALLKSRKNRVVVRMTNLYSYVQYVVHNSNGDQSMLSISSKLLTKFGWDKSFKSIPAAYLTGYLFGKKVLADKKLVNDVIFDTGLHRSFKGGRIYALLNGVYDAGIKFNVDKKMFPSEDRVKGVHIKKEALFTKVKENIDKSK